MFDRESLCLQVEADNPKLAQLAAMDEGQRRMYTLEGYSRSIGKV
jgi:hypothetical protein